MNLISWIYGQLRSNKDVLIANNVFIASYIDLMFSLCCRSWLSQAVNDLTEDDHGL